MGPVNGPPKGRPQQATNRAPEPHRGPPVSLETATYISGLTATNPASSDGLSQADDHLRLIKATLLATFPNITGAVTGTHTQLNTLTSATYPFVAASYEANSVTLAKMAQIATLSVLGRATASTGNVEVLSAPALGQSILAAADLATLAAALHTVNAGLFSTGDVKLTLKTSADTGWVLCNDGTIGDASSSATTRANADTLALYTLVYNNVSDAYAPVTGGRGASAAVDYAAHKPMALTKMLGRALGISGAGSGLTSRALGLTFGEENHALVSAENGPHIHTATTIIDTTNFQLNGTNGTSASAAGNSYPITNTGGATATTTVASSGSGTAHNTMQPTAFLNAMIKL